MRRITLVLLFVSCLASSGIALLSDANAARQQNSEASAPSSAAAKAAPRNESKAQQSPTAASDNRGRSRHVSRKVQLPTPARSKPASHPKPLQRDHERSRFANDRVHQSTASKPAAVAKTHTFLMRPVTGSAVDGRQFRLGRNTAAAAAIGGSANARKDTQVLNGTGATRRH